MKLTKDEEEFVLDYLAQGGSLVEDYLSAKLPYSKLEIIEYCSDLDFRAKLKELQDIYHYESIRQLKAGAPQAAAFLMDSMSFSKSVAAGNINAAKHILEISGISAGPYEDTASADPSDDELVDIISKLPKDLLKKALEVDND